MVYLNDLLVHATDFEQALVNLPQVFSAIRGAGLRLHPKKCNLLQRETKFLGHVVGADGVGTDPAKVEAVQNWRVPRSVSEVRSFLGLASYYQRFVCDFASIAIAHYIASPPRDRSSSGMRVARLPSLSCVRP